MPEDIPELYDLENFHDYMSNLTAVRDNLDLIREDANAYAFEDILSTLEAASFFLTTQLDGIRQYMEGDPQIVSESERFMQLLKSD